MPASSSWSPQVARQPCSVGSSSGSATSGASAIQSLGRVSESGRDRVSGPVSDLEEALARRAAAPREPVAAVLARELDALLF